MVIFNSYVKLPEGSRDGALIPIGDWSSEKTRDWSLIPIGDDLFKWGFSSIEVSILKYWKIIELRNLGMDQYLCSKWGDELSPGSSLIPQSRDSMQSLRTEQTCSFKQTINKWYLPVWSCIIYIYIYMYNIYIYMYNIYMYNIYIYVYAHICSSCESFVWLTACTGTLSPKSRTWVCPKNRVPQILMVNHHVPYHHIIIGSV